jgi:nicotinate-nucleotide pyrophosphorylase (carboxylating)
MPSSLDRRDVLPLIRRALAEDAARHDVTSRAVLPSSLRIRAGVIAQSPGIVAGGPVAAWTFHAIDPSVRCVLKRREGARVARGETIMSIEGRARSIFAAERVALNLIAHLSGVATLTRAFVDRVHGTRARIYDTRKTLPGLRALEKYAVRMGGGWNHRLDLRDAILIKTNHLRALSAQRHTQRARLIQEVVRLAHRQTSNGAFVAIEVTTRQELEAALQAAPDMILLDNWRLADLNQAVRIRNSSQPMNRRSQLEVSGGVTLANVRAIARAGVDRISVGRLTHSAPSLDCSLRVT